MAEIQMKPSQFIAEQARTIYERKNGKHLTSWQTPTNDCMLQAILNFIDDNFDDIKVHQPDLPTIQLEETETNDSQPKYR